MKQTFSSFISVHFQRIVSKTVTRRSRKSIQSSHSKSLFYHDPREGFFNLISHRVVLLDDTVAQVEFIGDVHIIYLYIAHLKAHRFLITSLSCNEIVVVHSDT